MTDRKTPPRSFGSLDKTTDKKAAKKAGKRAFDVKPRCYETHQPLQIVDPTTGQTLEVHGGSCYNPKLMDITVGLDSSQTPRPTRGYPWVKGQYSFSFPIKNNSVPTEPEQFKKLITWLVARLRSGKSVHIGCIGGHGRTGLVLAALYHEITGDTDAITAVRKGYCQKAVESKAQTVFLKKHYGITPVAVVFDDKLRATSSSWATARPLPEPWPETDEYFD